MKSKGSKSKGRARGWDISTSDGVRLDIVSLASGARFGTVLAGLEKGRGRGAFRSKPRPSHLSRCKFLKEELSRSSPFRFEDFPLAMPSFMCVVSSSRYRASTREVTARKGKDEGLPDSKQTEISRNLSKFALPIQSQFLSSGSVGVTQQLN
jgi:hypothetical protein